MPTKLTLRLDEDLILKAKAYGRRRGKSVSQMVADYFRSLETTATKESLAAPPLTLSLRGILRDSGVDESDYRAYQEERYH
ncbi:MAG: hypothetical protein KIT00_04810 [Rhodospirillales bacterium]|nr:hypothetical protein [Rhodospirillales bacterium]